ncbi:uncharacterized protein LOC142181763 [Nicotiana tabacum]|uniref:Uncharacterized protein LOC142181763 n=1 Tax=Nicotiana tabacum TaxID=4097 RepID=A0AC58UPG1_TOBAC
MSGTEAAAAIIASGSTTSAVNNDSNHLYHLHSSNTPGMAKNKLGFINGSVAEPAMRDKEYPLWSRCNDMVTSWLLNSLTKEIGDNVIYSRTAKDLWSSLEHRFGQSSGAKLYHLQKEISKTCQGNSSISGYFTTFKRLWDELLT